METQASTAKSLTESYNIEDTKHLDPTIYDFSCTPFQPYLIVLRQIHEHRDEIRLEVFDLNDLCEFTQLSSSSPSHLNKYLFLIMLMLIIF